jgi:hypothetical protein
MIHYHLADKVVFDEIGGETVLLNLDSGQYFTLDEVGTRILQLLGQQGTVDSTIATMTREYDATPDRIRSDLNNLLQELLSHGLIEKSSQEV